jgi:mevalonate kinase
VSPATASAPGKLMLFGEHAVVYGHPCIVTAVDLRMQVSATICSTKQVSIQVSILSEPFVATIEEFLVLESLPREIQFVASAVKRFWQYTNETFGVDITTRSQFSHSYGLGSSSAVTVATIKALAHAVQAEIDLDQVFRLSYEAVLDVQQGIGSGFDVAAATYGGTLYYVTGGKIIRPIPVEDLPMIVGYSGVKASTREYVRKVADLRQSFPELVDFIMGSIEVVVNDAEQAFLQYDYQKVGQLMNFNQGFLHALGVSTYELDYLIAAARLNGAYGAKLSGAGGGDCIIALVSNDARKKVEDAIQQSRQHDVPNAEVIPVRTGDEGVRID